MHTYIKNMGSFIKPLNTGIKSLPLPHFLTVLKNVFLFPI